MKQKGMTFIETMVCLFVISIFLLSIKGYTKMIERIQFNNLIDQVESSVKMAQQSAWLQKTVYRIAYEENCIKIKDSRCTQYEIPMPEHIEVSVGVKSGDSNRTRDIFFCEGLAPHAAGTITMKNRRSCQLVQITVRPATGKVARYISQLYKD